MKTKTIAIIILFFLYCTRFLSSFSIGTTLDNGITISASYTPTPVNEATKIQIETQNYIFTIFDVIVKGKYEKIVFSKGCTIFSIIKQGKKSEEENMLWSYCYQIHKPYQNILPRQLG